jgi:hypothetical protein
MKNEKKAGEVERRKHFALVEITGMYVGVFDKEPLSLFTFRQGVSIGMGRLATLFYCFGIGISCMIPRDEVSVLISGIPLEYDTPKSHRYQTPAFKWISIGIFSSIIDPCWSHKKLVNIYFATSKPPNNLILQCKHYSKISSKIAIFFHPLLNP